MDIQSDSSNVMGFSLTHYSIHLYLLELVKLTVKFEKIH